MDRPKEGRHLLLTESHRWDQAGCSPWGCGIGYLGGGGKACGAILANCHLSDSNSNVGTEL